MKKAAAKKPVAKKAATKKPAAKKKTAKATKSVDPKQMLKNLQDELKQLKADIKDANARSAALMKLELEKDKARGRFSKQYEQDVKNMLKKIK